MEQQASIIEMYYLLKFEKWNVKTLRENPDYNRRLLNTEPHVEVIKIFKSVLKNFLIDPSYAKKIV